MKKGSVELCDNYRPISLVCVIYKLFASLLLRRLKEAGAEQRLSTTQFGFRSGCGTNDAIFAVRRHIDLALAQRYGRRGIVALDWKKAFDSVNVEALLTALQRFGFPSKLVRIIEHVYSDRRFRVMDGQQFSTERAQLSGISQGCPLSPFLFVVLMSVVVHDSLGAMSAETKDHYSRGLLDILLYADDTLLVGVESSRLQNCLDKVASVGNSYGLDLHWDKFQLLQVNDTFNLQSPHGQQIPPSLRLAYLGTSIYADGGVKAELNQKLGVAWGDFCALHRVWKHSTLCFARKVRIYNAVVISRLLYGLSSAHLNVAETRRLNGFQCRCMRVILGIKPSFISRVSNAEVLKRAQQNDLSCLLLHQQLLLFGRIARAPPDDPLRLLTFVPGSISPLTSHYIRRIGRPRSEWASKLRDVALRMTADAARVVHDAAAWKRIVAEYCRVRR